MLVLTATEDRYYHYQYHCGNTKENTQVDMSNVILLKNVRADLGPQSRPFTTS